jgi:putative membrane protein
MKIAYLLIGLLGLGGAVYLVAQEGPHLIFAAFAAAGWGTLLVSALHFLHMAVAGYGWQLLWRAGRRPPLTLFIWVLWIREAVNALLPVARIGGEVASLRLLTRHGLPTSSAVGSLVVETTISVGTTFLFVILGLGLLSLHAPQHALYLQWALGLGVFALMIGGLIALQSFGAFRLLARITHALAGDKFAKFIATGAKLDRAVAAFYAHPWRLAQCSFLSFMAWFISAAELWLALHFLGYKADFTDGIILEAMLMATGSAAFFVPASLGVQEATFLLFGQMLGIPPQTCLALALIRRSRDVVLMAPGLILWQMQEGSGWINRFSKKRQSSQTLPPAS